MSKVVFTGSLARLLVALGFVAGTGLGLGTAYASNDDFDHDVEAGLEQLQDDPAAQETRNLVQEGEEHQVRAGDGQTDLGALEEPEGDVDDESDDTDDQDDNSDQPEDAAGDVDEDSEEDIAASTPEADDDELEGEEEDADEDESEDEQEDEVEQEDDDEHDEDDED